MRLGERLRHQQDEFELSLELQQEILSAPPDSLYEVVLQAAVRTVDGAEGGSVLVRDGELFRYRAAVGYDLASLRSVAYSDADKQGREYVLGLMRSAKLDVAIDAGGNLIGKRAGSINTLRPLLIGSHIDTVPEGGNYDGVVGSM